MTHFDSSRPSILTSLISEPPDDVTIRGLLMVIGKLAISRRRNESPVVDIWDKLRGLGQGSSFREGGETGGEGMCSQFVPVKIIHGHAGRRGRTYPDK